MSIFDDLVQLFNGNNARYRVLEHALEGRSEAVSKIRGTPLHQGAKAMVVKIKITNQDRKYVLAILPADKQIAFDKIKTYFNAKAAMMASVEEVTRLTGCEIGAVPPVSFNEELKVIVDPELVSKNPNEIVFNAGSLEKSIFLNTQDYLNIVQPEQFIFQK